MDWCCVKHTLTGEDCRNRFPVRAVTEQPTICNDDFARWVREWCDMSDNIYIWFYTLECHLQRFSVFDILYDNVRYFRDCGVKGLMWEHDDSGFGFMRLDFQLVYELISVSYTHLDVYKRQSETRPCRRYATGYSL